MRNIYEYDTVILGGGPAGLSAGIYMARSNAKTAIIDISMLGGQPSNYLELENYPGFPIIGGYDLMEKFEEHEEGYYDAILMDMRMPEMDGLEATKTIRAMDRPDAKTIPIIALTANAFDEDVQRSMQAGLNAHLSKPVQPDVLYETLENLIED